MRVSSSQWMHIETYLGCQVQLNLEEQWFQANVKGHALTHPTLGGIKQAIDAKLQELNANPVRTRFGPIHVLVQSVARPNANADRPLDRIGASVWHDYLWYDTQTQNWYESEDARVSYAEARNYGYDNQRQPTRPLSPVVINHIIPFDMLPKGFADKANAIFEELGEFWPIIYEINRQYTEVLNTLAMRDVDKKAKMLTYVAEHFAEPIK